MAGRWQGLQEGLPLPCLVYPDALSQDTELRGAL